MRVVFTTNTITIGQIGNCKYDSFDIVGDHRGYGIATVHGDYSAFDDIGLIY